MTQEQYRTLRNTMSKIENLDQASKRLTEIRKKISHDTVCQYDKRFVFTDDCYVIREDMINFLDDQIKKIDKEIDELVNSMEKP